MTYVKPENALYITHEIIRHYYHILYTYIIWIHYVLIIAPYLILKHMKFKDVALLIYSNIYMINSYYTKYCTLMQIHGTRYITVTYGFCTYAVTYAFEICI